MAAKKKKKAPARAGATKRKKKASKAAKAKRAPAKKSKARKAAKRPAKKARKTKAAARKAPAKKAAASARAGATKKKAAPKKKQTMGEGDYAASKSFLKDQSSFVERNKTNIPAMGQAAEKALDGPEGNALREAEASGLARSRDTF